MYQVDAGALRGSCVCCELIDLELIRDVDLVFYPHKILKCLFNDTQ